ncbi:hypothetical protein E2C01_091874 [Portunus trituberculatus]|uniref:Uncharacterized protein n=1 Tax=Portunus trituberculatus TaxID=210409 RepID=A0A5B7JPV0_PORTR|nr:hypothetical protein [Portunus trituberculatus]
MAENKATFVLYEWGVPSYNYTVVCCANQGITTFVGQVDNGVSPRYQHCEVLLTVVGVTLSTLSAVRSGNLESLCWLPGSKGFVGSTSLSELLIFAFILILVGCQYIFLLFFLTSLLLNTSLPLC